MQAPFISAFSQNEVSVFENENGKEYELYMRLDDKFRSDTNDILKTKIRSNEGFFVTLGDVATISFEQKPASISRFNRADEIKFLANTKNNAPLNSVANEISKKLDEICLQISSIISWICRAHGRYKCFFYLYGER